MAWSRAGRALTLRRFLRRSWTAPRPGRRRKAKRALSSRCARGSREMATCATPARSVAPSVRTARIAPAGKPAQCLTRLSRSSSTPAIRIPSRSSTAAASAWKALTPRMSTGDILAQVRGAEPARLGGRFPRHQVERLMQGAPEPRRVHEARQAAAVEERLDQGLARRPPEHRAVGEALPLPRVVVHVLETRGHEAGADGVAQMGDRERVHAHEGAQVTVALAD